MPGKTLLEHVDDALASAGETERELRAMVLFDRTQPRDPVQVKVLSILTELRSAITDLTAHVKETLNAD